MEDFEGLSKEEKESLEQAIERLRKFFQEKNFENEDDVREFLEKLTSENCGYEIKSIVMDLNFIDEYKDVVGGEIPHVNAEDLSYRMGLFDLTGTSYYLANYIYDQFDKLPEGTGNMYDVAEKLSELNTRLENYKGATWGNRVFAGQGLIDPENFPQTVDGVSKFSKIYGLIVENAKDLKLTGIDAKRYIEKESRIQIGNNISIKERMHALSATLANEFESHGLDYDDEKSEEILKVLDEFMRGEIPDAEDINSLAYRAFLASNTDVIKKSQKIATLFTFICWLFNVGDVKESDYLKIYNKVGEIVEQK